MYHVELRHFPHNAWRFNLSEQELAAIVQPWVREQAIDVGERKWSPHLARLTLLEGPKLDLTELSMGRGWRSAQRRSEDVTERVLDAAREAMHGHVPEEGVGAVASAAAVNQAAAAAAAASAPAAAAPALNDPIALGVQLAALLGPDPTALLDAWRAAAAGSPGLAPSDSLALAERVLRRAGGQPG